MKILTILLLLYIFTPLLAQSHLRYWEQHVDRFISIIPQYSTQTIQIQKVIPSRNLSPRIENIMINHTYLYPDQLAVRETSCFGKKALKISEGQELFIKTNSPFMVFFSTKTASRYYNLEEYYGKTLYSINVNYMVEAEYINKSYIASIPLNLKCSYITNPYLKMIGNIHIDFYDQKQQKKHQFNFVIVCASEQVIQQFSSIYRPGYIFFWIYLSLTLQIYHEYNRQMSHYGLFLVYLVCSMLIFQQFTSYIVAFIIIATVIFAQKKDATINNKTFALYNVFLFASTLLIIFTYWSITNDYEWNSLWIAYQNFIKTHITMFLIIRLVKLSRFRYVFWYFISVAAFSIMYSGNNNIFFELNFKNPIDMTCFKADLFFPLMMLPICNYFTSITSWMHRVIGVAITIATVLPLDWAIKLMATVFVGILVYEIKTKDLRIIKHRY